MDMVDKPHRKADRPCVDSAAGHMHHGRGGGGDRDTLLELQSGASDCGLHVSHVGVTRGSQSFIACPRHGRLPPARLLWCRHQNGASVSWRLAQISSSNERAQLPAAAPRHPLWVWSVDGWKQSAALREVRCRHARGGLCHLESRAILPSAPHAAPHRADDSPTCTRRRNGRKLRHLLSLFPLTPSRLMWCRHHDGSTVSCCLGFLSFQQCALLAASPTIHQISGRG